MSITRGVLTMRVVDKWNIGDHTTRYRLENGWFIDRANTNAHRAYGYKYSLWEPGASPTGGAAFRGGSSTLKAAIAIASRFAAA